MKKFLFSLIASSILFAASGMAQSGAGEPSLSILSSPELIARPGQVPAERFRFRIVDGQGRPMSGLTATFMVNKGVFLGGQEPPFGTFGFFVVPTMEGRSESVHVVTDHDGIATAPAFRLSKESFQVSGAVLPERGNEAIGWTHLVVNYKITLDENAPNFTAGDGSGGTALPIDSRTALGIAVFGLLALGLSRLRRGSSAR